MQVEIFSLDYDFFCYTSQHTDIYGRDTHSVDDRSHTPPSARIIHKTNQLVETPNLEKP